MSTHKFESILFDTLVGLSQALALKLEWCNDSKNDDTTGPFTMQTVRRPNLASLH